MIAEPDSTLESLSALDPSSIAVRTFANPPLDGDTANHPWWRRAEIPAAGGHGNARSVAAVQSIIAGRGEARGTRLVSPETCDMVFEEQSYTKDLVLGMRMRYGMGYGLGSDLIPIGPRACFWAGFGGSVVVMDQDLGLTVAYVMNRMAPALLGDTRGFGLVLAAAGAASGA